MKIKSQMLRKEKKKCKIVIDVRDCIMGVIEYGSLK
jgi:hypothetical protein